MISCPETAAATDAREDSGALAKAILNLLEDAAGEQSHLADTQSAVLNILGDAAAEKVQLQAAWKAVLNILEDTAGEQMRMSDTHSAVLNILEDSTSEQRRLVDARRAMVNILDDFDSSRNRDIERINREMASEIVVRKRTEESLSATNKELEAFSYSVAHDLRAPLRSIDGFSLALLEDCGDKLEEEAKDYLGRIRAAAKRMALLIDELLKLARISRGEVHYETVDLSAMATKIIAELKEREPQRQVETVVADAITAIADVSSIRAVLENLLANAWKFTGRQEDARVEFGVSREDGKQVYFVRDNGAGFDMNYAAKLFGVFQRLHSESEFPGTGIGLAIVQRVIHRHGGRVWAEGAVGKGATFSFTLHESKEA
jgi:signal transduction histidine kinase